MTYAEHIYRRLQGDVESARMETTYWRNKFEAALKVMAESAHLQARPPMMLANAESFNAGKAMAFNEAKYTIGIDTSDGFHTVTTFRMAPGQPTTLVASQRLPDDNRERIAAMVEQMGIDGYGTPAIAAAIRKGGQQ